MLRLGRKERENVMNTSNWFDVETVAHQRQAEIENYVRQTAQLRNVSSRRLSSSRVPVESRSRFVKHSQPAYADYHYVHPLTKSTRMCLFNSYRSQGVHIDPHQLISGAGLGKTFQIKE